MFPVPLKRKEEEKKPYKSKSIAGDVVFLIVGVWLFRFLAVTAATFSIVMSFCLVQSVWIEHHGHFVGNKNRKKNNSASLMNTTMEWHWRKKRREKSYSVRDIVI